ncbi:probable calcium-binding protein CML45 [Dendrobium catenatum]|uniref:Putative calcium-binding protein CML45 n=1 Tax=Dendrobium catenatum TaxID=906689 RepID=A0A2I0WGG2_9ASPA|nr:probable calcium-binding protein CML45 [Dendrobium catenatum]PKU74757.1 putative calcium-binding protein CML45 [Dendrobium catenatum]
MEKSLLSTELVGFIILETIISFFARFLKLSKRYFSFPSRFSKTTKSQLRAEEERAEAEKLITREEVELVMERMGLMMRGNEEGEQKLKEFMLEEEVVAMFDEKEPSLEEVKEAFAVFDENCDGFVDAGELQRVLWKLGFERTGLDSCMEMIGAYDENGDGKIDFGEFVKFMESSFC